MEQMSERNIVQRTPCRTARAPDDVNAAVPRRKDQGLRDANLVPSGKGIGRWIDAAHACDKYKVTGARAQTPGSCGLDGAGGRKRLHAAW